MITATSTGRKFATQLTDGWGHYIFADVPDEGGGDLYQRPGELIAEGYAACMNITAQKLLAEQGYPIDQVETQVEMVRRGCARERQGGDPGADHPLPRVQDPGRGN